MSGIPASLQPLAVPIGQLAPYGANPRRGNVGAIADSLRANGQYRPVVVNTRTQQILAGNHTFLAARELGWTELAATYVDVDDEQAARIVLVDNRTNDLAEYDDAQLVELLGTLPDLTGTGYDQDALDQLLAELARSAPATALTDPDEVPPVPAEPVTQLGDRWQLGPHTLLCGDAVDGMVTLLGSAAVDCVWTDPPYGVSYVGKTVDALTIEGDDDPVKLQQLLQLSFAAAAAVTKPGGVWYVAAPGGPLHLIFAEVLHDLGIWRQTLNWVKDAFVMGRSDYHYRHEPIFYGWKPGAAHYFIGERTQDTVWDIPRPNRNAEHPTMKPVALIDRALRNSTLPGETVLDMFAGSGSTLIAAHQTGRVARLVEIDPRYADVICRRYQEHTGEKPTRNGEPHDFTVEAAEAAE